MAAFESFRRNKALKKMLAMVILINLNYVCFLVLDDSIEILK